MDRRSTRGRALHGSRSSETPNDAHLVVPTEKTTATAGRPTFPLLYATVNERLAKSEFVFIGFVVAVAAALVLYRLGARNIWADEATTFGTASQHGAALWHWALHDGGNMLGYYLAMHVWVTLFGTSLDVLRLPTALCFVASVPCVYLLVRRLYDRRSATVSALVFEVSSPLVYWGQEARAYVPALFFLLLSALALVIAVQQRRRSAWILFASCAALAAYMLLLAALVVMAQVVSLALFGPRRIEVRRLVIASCAVGVAWVPLLIVAIHQGGAQISWIAPLSLRSGLQTLPLLLSASGALAVIIAGAALVAGLVIALQQVVSKRRSATAFGAALLVGWVVFPLLALVVISLAVQPVLTDRYVLPIVPGVSMLIGIACARLPSRLLVAVVTAFVLVVRVGPLATGYGSSIESWAVATNVVAHHLEAGDCLVFFVADGYTSFDYYLAQEPASIRRLAVSVLPDMPFSTKTPYELDPATIPAHRLPVVVANCPRIWLVESDDSPIPPPLPRYALLKQQRERTLKAELSSNYHATTHYRFATTYSGRAIVATLYLRQPAAPRA